MILIVLAGLCLATVPLFHGRIVRLAQLNVRGLWLTPLALALQVLIVTIAPSGSPTLHAVVHVATYVLIAIFLALNIRIPGAPVIAVGTVANMLAIVANGGVMPAAREAQRLAGLAEGGGFHNSGVVAHPHLLWLGDILPVPGPLPNVLSIGDCLIFAGMLVLLHRTCGTTLPFAGRRRLRRPLESEAAPLVRIIEELCALLDGLLLTGGRGEAASQCRSTGDRLALVLFDPVWLDCATDAVDGIAEAYWRETWHSSSPMNELRPASSAQLDQALISLQVALHRLGAKGASLSVAERAKTAAMARRAWLTLEAGARDLSRQSPPAAGEHRTRGRAAAPAPVAAG